MIVRCVSELSWEHGFVRDFFDDVFSLGVLFLFCFLWARSAGFSLFCASFFGNLIDVFRILNFFLNWMGAWVCLFGFACCLAWFFFRRYIWCGCTDCVFLSVGAQCRVFPI